MPIIKCPICLARFELADSPSPPFCSERCRKIDLGRWLGESYSVPVEPDEDGPDRHGSDDEPPSTDDN
jgi:uncharacterized protein